MYQVHPNIAPTPAELPEGAIQIIHTLIPQENDEVGIYSHTLGIQSLEEYKRISQIIAEHGGDPLF